MNVLASLEYFPVLSYVVAFILVVVLKEAYNVWIVPLILILSIIQLPVHCSPASHWNDTSEPSLSSTSLIHRLPIP